MYSYRCQTMGCGLYRKARHSSKETRSKSRGPQPPLRTMSPDLSQGLHDPESPYEAPGNIVTMRAEEAASRRRAMLNYASELRVRSPQCVAYIGCVAVRCSLIYECCSIIYEFITQVTICTSRLGVTRLSSVAAVVTQVAKHWRRLDCIYLQARAYCCKVCGGDARSAAQACSSGGCSCASDVCSASIHCSNDHAQRCKASDSRLVQA
jgi:hypothetical protein